MELDDLLDPLCPEDGALLGISVCAVCGTDIKMCEQGHRDLVFPRVLGHEIGGGIVEMDDLAEGDLVQVWPGLTCGRCQSCLR